jgi:D-Tyr-tRNAtyr deacylase
MVAMTETGSGSGFHEEDEPVEKIVAIFEAGTKGVTAPPVQAAGQILVASQFMLVTPSPQGQTATEPGSQRPELVQA